MWSYNEGLVRSIHGKYNTSFQLNTLGGNSNIFIAGDTYPSSAYFQSVVRAVPGVPDAVFIPASAATGGEVYCQFEGDLSISVDHNICVQPGGKTLNYHRPSGLETMLEIITCSLCDFLFV